MSDLQRLVGEFTGTGASGAVRGRSVVVGIMKIGNFTADVDIEARSVFAASTQVTYWAPILTFNAPGVHVFDVPLEMEWRLNCTSFTVGAIIWVMETSERTRYV